MQHKKGGKDRIYLQRDWWLKSVFDTAELCNIMHVPLTCLTMSSPNLILMTAFAVSLSVVALSLETFLENATLSGWPSSNHGRGNSHHRHTTHGSHQHSSGNVWSLLTHMNDVSLGYRARGEGPVRGCECARHLNAFDVCEGGSPVILLLTAKSSRSSRPFI